MRVAAGVLLIITAVINLIASLGYLGGGAVATGVGSVSESAYEASLLEAESSMTAAEAEEYAEVTDGLRSAGGLLLGMGVLLLVSVGVLIAGAVFLFQTKQAKFAMSAGIMALVVEGLGIAISSFGIMNVIGLVAGVLTIIAVRSYPSAAPADEAPAVA